LAQLTYSGKERNNAFHPTLILPQPSRQSAGFGAPSIGETTPIDFQNGANPRSNPKIC